MNFNKAYYLLRQGNLIKLPSWKGYWLWENNTIMMYCKDGRILDIRETDDVSFTFNNIVSDNWEIATKDNSIFNEVNK